MTINRKQKRIKHSSIENLDCELSRIVQNWAKNIQKSYHRYYNNDYVIYDLDAVKLLDSDKDLSYYEKFKIYSKYHTNVNGMNIEKYINDLKTNPKFSGYLHTEDIHPVNYNLTFYRNYRLKNEPFKQIEYFYMLNKFLLEKNEELTFKDFIENFSKEELNSVIEDFKKIIPHNKTEKLAKFFRGNFSIGVNEPTKITNRLLSLNIKKWNQLLNYKVFNSARNLQNMDIYLDEVFNSKEEYSKEYIESYFYVVLTEKFNGLEDNLKYKNYSNFRKVFLENWVRSINSVDTIYYTYILDFIKENKEELTYDDLYSIFKLTDPEHKKWVNRNPSKTLEILKIGLEKYGIKFINFAIYINDNKIYYSYSEWKKIMDKINVDLTPKLALSLI